MTTLGKVELAKHHPLCTSKNNFGISVHMQELMCYTGQSMVYKEAEVLLEKTIGVEVSGMQIQRLCQHYGKKLEQLIKLNCESLIPKVETAKKDDPAYVMMDGSMIYTRDEDWKELKLGSVFYDSQIIDIQSKRQYKSYLDKNWLIGSGPIEAAHRSVIQQRMKLSGQKWSTQGANSIATLRCFNKSGAWDKVKSLIITAA